MYSNTGKLFLGLFLDIQQALPTTKVFMPKSNEIGQNFNKNPIFRKNSISMM